MLAMLLTSGWPDGMTLRASSYDRGRGGWLSSDLRYNRHWWSPLFNATFRPSRLALWTVKIMKIKQFHRSFFIARLSTYFPQDPPFGASNRVQISAKKYVKSWFSSMSWDCRLSFLQKDWTASKLAVGFNKFVTDVKIAFLECNDAIVASPEFLRCFNSLNE